MTESVSSVLTLLCSGIQLFRAERQIADYILNHLDESVAMTSAELARASSTSEATVTRFCRKLGFDNYRAFQFSLVHDVMEESSQPEFSYEVELDDIPRSLHNILANKINELTATFHAIDPENLKRILAVLKQADTIEIAAVGNTIPVALDAAFKFNQLGLRCVTSEISEKLSALALTLTEKDLLLLISNSGRSCRLQQIAQSAKQNHTPVILITCDRSSPLAGLADYLLISTNREKLLTTDEFAFSRISAISIVEILYHFMLVSTPGAKENIRRHEMLMRSDKIQPQAVSTGTVLSAVNSYSSSSDKK